MRPLRQSVAVVALLLAGCAAVPPVPPSTPPPVSQPAPPPPAPVATPAVVPESVPPPIEALARAAPLPATRPMPLLATGKPVDWWFTFKFNSASFPGCTPTGQNRHCTFGGTVKTYSKPWSQQYVYASSDHSSLAKGDGCAGDTLADPIGATFDQIYNQSLHYVVWNDQFYNAPKISGCTTFCPSPWGHSKGVVAWNDAGEGLLLQVTTPSWPAAASKIHPRVADGNTLGCVIDNNILVSQHFFALRLTKSDLLVVLGALQNASVVTNPSDVQLVSNGGPPDVQAMVASLGTRSNITAFTKDTLSTGVTLISKPSKLNVPPWQFVSAVLGGVSLRVASWWSSSKIYTTPANKKIGCWDASLGKPGRVEIATSGRWDNTEFGLVGGSSPDRNHAKIAVSISNSKHLSIFGDMNQEGSLSGNCGAKQNGRGGLFFVIEDKDLTTSLAGLLDGDTALTRASANR